MNEDVAWFVFWDNNEAANQLEDEARKRFRCRRCWHQLLAHPGGHCTTSGCRCPVYRGNGPRAGVDYPTTGNDLVCATLLEVRAWVEAQSAMLRLDPFLTEEERAGVAEWPAMFASLLPSIRADGEGGYSLDYTTGNITLGLWEQPPQVLEWQEES